MAHFDGMFTWLGARLPLGMLLMRLLPLIISADPNANNITNFFLRLSSDLTVFAVAMAGFFFAIAALFYMSSGLTGSERTRQIAIGSLYAAMGGLALALLSGTFAVLVNNAATGATAGGGA